MDSEKHMFSLAFTINSPSIGQLIVNISGSFSLVEKLVFQNLSYLYQG